MTAFLGLPHVRHAHADQTTVSTCRAPATRSESRLRVDDGTTLIDLVVAMVLMSIFMGMFTGAVIMMNNAMNKAQAVNQTSDQLNQAFLALDKTVRYATAISLPTGLNAPGDVYVEFLTTNTGHNVCTQLRVDVTAKQLQQRTWTETNKIASNVSPGPTPPVSPPAFLPLASGIVNTASDVTFQYMAPTGNSSFQQLKINLLSKSQSGTMVTPSQSSFTFTALNSLGPAPASVCEGEGRP